MYGICVSLHLPVYEAISRVLNIELKVSAGSQAQFDVFFFLYLGLVRYIMLITESAVVSLSLSSEC